MVNKTEVDAFWNSLAFSMIQWKSIVLSKLISVSQNCVSPFTLLCNHVVCVCVCVCQCIYNTSPCHLRNSYIIISYRCLTIPLNGYISITLIKALLQDIRFFKCQIHKWHCSKHFYSYIFFLHIGVSLINVTFGGSTVHKSQSFQAPMSPVFKQKQLVLIS